MSRTTTAGRPGCRRRQARQDPPRGAPVLDAREAKKKAALARIFIASPTRSAGAWTSRRRIEIVDGLALGDTVLLERGRDLIGFAICTRPAVSERRPAPST